LPKLVLGLGAVYFAAYVVLSLGGRYVDHNQGGEDNRRSWAPAFCGESHSSPAGRTKFRLTVWGWVFLPPLLVDQWLIHPTRFES
jgi:hypothetical protein